MGVGRAKDEVVLEDEGGYPKIVRRNGGSFVAKLEVDLRVVMRGLLVSQEDGDTRAAEETLEIGGIG